jgi:hypothetical protein
MAVTTAVGEERMRNRMSLMESAFLPRRDTDGQTRGGDPVAGGRQCGARLSAVLGCYRRAKLPHIGPKGCPLA